MAWLIKNCRLPYLTNYRLAGDVTNEHTISNALVVCWIAASVCYTDSRILQIQSTKAPKLGNYNILINSRTAIFNFEMF